MNDREITRLLEKGKLEMPDRNFEEKVMQKIKFTALIIKQRNKNLRLSWIFLAASTLLIPVAITILSRDPYIETILKRFINLDNIGHSLIPAVVLLFAIIILLQIDNLFHLTLQPK